MQERIIWLKSKFRIQDEKVGVKKTTTKMHGKRNRIEFNEEKNIQCNNKMTEKLENISIITR